jgi:hypothetical protein
MRDLSGWSSCVVSNALWGSGSRGDSRKNALWGSKGSKGAGASDRGEAPSGRSSAVARRASWADEAAPR